MSIDSGDNPDIGADPSPVTPAINIAPPNATGAQLHAFLIFLNINKFLHLILLLSPWIAASQQNQWNPDLRPASISSSIKLWHQLALG